MNEIGLVGVVRCKHCYKRHTGECPMMYEETFEIDEYGDHDYHTIVHDYTIDDGFCNFGSRTRNRGY